MFFWNSLVFSMIQQMLVIWSLVPLPFLNPAWTSGSSQFMYHWSPAWRIYDPTLPYMTTGKSIALTRWTFIGKVISLFFNMLPRFVIAFLPRSKCLLIPWLQSLSAVILEPKKAKSVTVSPLFLYHTSEVTVAALCTTPAHKPAAPNISPKIHPVQKGQGPAEASGPWAPACLVSSQQLAFPDVNRRSMCAIALGLSPKAAVRGNILPTGGCSRERWKL